MMVPNVISTAVEPLGGSTTAAGGIRVAVDVPVVTGGGIGVEVLVDVAVGVAVDVDVAVAIAAAVDVAVDVTVLVGVGVRVIVAAGLDLVTVTLPVALTVVVAGEAGVVTGEAGVACGFVEVCGRGGAIETPVDPSTIKRGEPPMKQPPVHVAPARSMVYCPLCALIDCLRPFASIRMACAACAGTAIVIGDGWRVHTTVVQASPRFTVT
jgi:hypothetical protein